MMAQLKSEMRKLLTVRSTYFLMLFVVIIIGIMCFWVQGYNFKGQVNERFFSDSLLGVASTLSFFVAIIAILMMTHEYRYNTIMHTLTLSNSRIKALLSKVLVLMAFVFIFSIAVHFLAFALMIIGHSLAGHPLPAQDINYLHFFAKSLFFCEGFALAGLIFAVLIRNQVATFAALFVLPNALEGVLNLLLKENSKYLPFTALQEVINPPPATFGDTGPFVIGDLSPGTAALVYLVYLAVGGFIALMLFLRRDAT